MWADNQQSVEYIVEQIVAQQPRFISSSIEKQQALAERMRDHLAEWACPAELADAGRLIPLLETNEINLGALPTPRGPAYELAAGYQQWKRSPLPLAPGRQQESPWSTQLLQKLFIASYEDETIPFLAMAELLSRLELIEQQSPDTQPIIVRSVRVALLPMLERYGLWELNRYATKLLFEHEDAAKRTTILNLVKASEERRQRVLEEALRLQSILPAGASVALHQVRPSRIYLNALNHEEIYGKEDATELLQQKASRLAIDITVQTKEACYLALGAVHQLWRPVGNYVKDHIGSPKFNGYQALHILVNISPTPDFSAEVEFFIASQEMRHVNAWGRIAEYRRQRQDPAWSEEGKAKAWWHHAEDCRRLLARHVVGDYSSPTYVFSPLGEIFELVQYATPLDYAFAVHSRVGHSYGGAKVNGRAVDTDFTLANGDIVKIKTGPHEKMSGRAKWLGQVKSGPAAKHLRREFSRQIRHTQRGRDLVHKSLKEWCARYGIKFSDVREESHLIQTARRWSVGDLEAFYAAVASGRVDPEAVANHIISLEMTHRVGYEDGSPLTLRPGGMQIAHCCRPTIDEAIVGRFTQPGTKYERVKIHRADCPMVRKTQVRPLIWRKADFKGLYEYVAHGFDREGILIDVLRPFYDFNTYLHKVQAERLPDESAQFYCLAELSDPSIAQKIKTSLDGVADITECTMRPLTLSPSEVFARRRKLEVVNPFHYELPARHKVEFVGRQTELSKLKRLLVAKATTNRIIIAGPWRVGKSSLLEYIAEHDQSEFGAAAVLIDCHRIPNLSLETLLGEIMQAVRERLAPEMDALGAYQIALGEDDYRDLFSNPLEGFHRFLQRARPLVNAGRNRRLVIMIDEFSDLYDDERNGKLDSAIFRNLRGLFEREADIIFITVVQTAALHQMSTQYRAELLELATPIYLGSLDDDSIQELLHRRLRLLDLSCDEATIHRVISEVGGNPYVANILCHSVVEHLMETGETTVEPQHIDRAIGEIMNSHGGVYFAHLTELLTTHTERALLKAFALAEPGVWQSLPEATEGASFRDHTVQSEIEGAIDHLLSKGLLASNDRKGIEAGYRVQIPLFARWLRETNINSAGKET